MTMKLIEVTEETPSTETSEHQCSACNSVWSCFKVGGPRYHMSSISQEYWTRLSGAGCDECNNYEADDNA